MKFIILMLLYPPLGHSGSISVIQGFESLLACKVAQEEMARVASSSNTKCVQLPANNKAARSAVAK